MHHLMFFSVLRHLIFLLYDVMTSILPRKKQTGLFSLDQKSQGSFLKTVQAVQTARALPLLKRVE